MADSSQIGARFEHATLQLFKQLFPLLGFDLLHHDIRRSGSQKGFDLFFQTCPHDAKGINVNFFVECKGAKSINPLPLDEFEGKPDQLLNSRFNPDYWILFSPLRYLTNEFQENLGSWSRSQYPFAFLTWARESRDEDRAGIYLDLYKLFPDIYSLFSSDVPDNIRNTPPEYALKEALDHLRTSISNSYDEFEDRVVFKGLIPGIRRITPQSIYKSKERDDSRLAKIRKGYYMLNSSDKFVWRAVCNDLDVRNERLSDELTKAVQGVKNPTESIWILGAPGCGKTTQLNRTAVDFTMVGYPVVLANSLELDEKARPVDYEEYLRKIFALHNAGCENDLKKPLLVLIDNPAARIETVSRLLDRFDGLEENFKCIFLLFEREVRYHQAEEESFIPDFVGGSKEKIYVDNRDKDFKEKVYKSFAAALSLPINDQAIAKSAFLENPQISIAEAVINFCKRTNNDDYRRFAMDWVDFDEVIKRLGLDNLTDLYKWISIVYQFGIALPISILRKVMPDIGENEFLDFRDFFTNDEYENLPVIVELKTLRARHELISQWHVEEKLSPTIRERLVALLKVIDADDALERSVFTSMLGRKQIVRRFLTRLNAADLEVLQQKATGHPLNQRILMMVEGWIHVSKREYSFARNVFKAVMEDHPTFLPPILEAAKVEFALRNESEAERLLQGLLVLDPNNLHARTELAKVYQLQKRYSQAEQVLKESLVIDPNQLHPRTELAKVYQTQKRYPEAELVLKECITLSSDDLNSRTELAKVHQVQKRYTEAEAVLTDLVGLDPKNLQARTELAKVYQVQKRYAEAEAVLKECIKLSPDDLNSRTELAKVYQVKKRYAEAEQVLKECITLSPNDLNSRTELAKVYQVQKRYAEAEAVLKESLVIDPNQLHPRTELAKVYQAQKRYAEAESVLKESLVIDPNQLHPRTELARVYQVQKRYAEAEAVLKESLVIDPNQLHPRTELAKVYQVQKRYVEAEGVLADLIGLDPNNLQARTELAKVYQVQKRYAEAEGVLADLIGLDPNNLQARTELARVYIKQGLFRRARAEVLDFLKKNPNADSEDIAHLILAHLNACYLMRRFQEGIELVDRLGCQFVSPELAEEYGRLLRSYDLANAVSFFRTATFLFNDASRLFSEAAICFKLGGVSDAEAVMKKAIQLAPEKESKYHDLYDTARQWNPIEFAQRDRGGVIERIEHTTHFDRPAIQGTIRADQPFGFRTTRYLNELFLKLTVNDRVFFDVNERGFAVNIEPEF